MSAEQKLTNATNLYIQGICQGNAKEALDTYIGDRYTQHSTGVADGKEGFLAFFIPFLERNPVRDFRVIRSIVDGQYVFLHVHQNLNNGEYYYVTADIFDTDANDKIIEHWDVIQEEVKETRSGRSMVDGPTEIEDEHKTEANREVVTAFMTNVLIAGQIDRIADYIAADEFAQHNPYLPDGLEGLTSRMQGAAEQCAAMQYNKIHKLLVQGNFAVALSEVTISGDPWCVIDIFRLKNDRILEHWDVQEKILPQDQWNNSGKF